MTSEETSNATDIDAILSWSKPIEVQTKNGPMILRKSRPTDEFWETWRNDYQHLKAAGISTMTDLEDPNKWWVCWWQPVPKEIVEARNKSVAMSNAVDANGFSVPCPDGRRFYPFQLAGIKYASERNGTLIGDEPGLGKTAQAIGIINLFEEINRVLIIAPMTLKANWERELCMWLTRKLSIGQATSEYFPRTDIVIAHYNILHKFPSRLSFMWDLLIVDECHRLGNNRTRQTKCVVGYKPSRKEQEKGVLPTSGIPARRKLMLSGTPFENRPAQLFPIINYLDPVSWPSRWKFEARYCGAHNNGFGWEAKDACNLEELAYKLRSSVMIRRRKMEVLKDLPPKTRQIVEMDADGFEAVIRNEQKVWHQHEDDLVEAQAGMEIAKASENPDEFKAAIEHLRKSTSLIFTEIARVRHETALAKVPAMIEMLHGELEEVGKIVCFAHHQDVITAMAQEFCGECVVITGETPQSERDTLVQRFQNDRKVKLFFGSIRATGEGITLTAASTVIFLENDWTASKMAQCSDRCHRIGQTDNVLVKYYILPGTIDAHMIQTWIHKEEILDQAMDSDRVEMMNEATVIPKAEPLGTRKQIAQDAAAITQAQCRAIHEGLKSLAGVCDGANRLDGAGFNKLDVRIGHSLAEAPGLSYKQAALGKKLLAKYSRQLGSEILTQCGIKMNPA
jgi:SWI/SNF-related matrix-associated actin-dependent regulator 1 of chromatin subfamily A